MADVAPAPADYLLNADEDDLDDLDVDELEKKKLQELEAKKKRLQEEAQRLAQLKEEEHHLRRWCPVVLLHPLGPAITATFHIVIGSLTLNMAVTDCTYPLKAYVRGQIFLSYAFLAFFSWIFIGPLPVQSLKLVIVGYLGLAGAFFIWNVIGMIFLSLGWACVFSTPTLYNVTVFMIVTFWICLIGMSVVTLRLRQKEWQIKAKKEVQSNLEKEAKEILEKDIEAKAGEERKELERAAMVEREAREKQLAERKAFFGESSEDDEDDDDTTESKSAGGKDHQNEEAEAEEAHTDSAAEDGDGEPHSLNDLDSDEESTEESEDDEESQEDGDEQQEEKEEDDEKVLNDVVEGEEEDESEQ